MNVVEYFESRGFSHEYPDYLLLVVGEYHIVIGDACGPRTLEKMGLSAPLYIQVQIENGARTIEHHDAKDSDDAARIVATLISKYKT